MRPTSKRTLEADPAVARRLVRLNQWGANTARPLVLHLLDRRAHGTATSPQIAAALHYIEAFLVRRLLFGRATANLNRILLGAVTGMPKDVEVDVAVRQYLSSGRKHYATDRELSHGIRCNASPSTSSRSSPESSNPRGPSNPQGTERAVNR